MATSHDHLTAALSTAKAELANLERERQSLHDRIEGLEEMLRGYGERPSERPRSHTGKYRHLHAYLVKHEPEVISLTFEDVERIAEVALPTSSRRYLAHWYGYKGSAVARAILDAGWKARSVSLEDETLELWPLQLLEPAFS